ncbi:MAG: hypothetical protein K2R93_14530 [Gemmatimonadaceae bacterium]|nr:hypothetical protein [Gemmatimonadaceae bacterium]
MTRANRWSTSPTRRDGEVLEHLAALIEDASRPPRFDDAVAAIATRMGRSVDRVEQALRRLHPEQVVIGHWHESELVVTPTTRRWGAVVHAVEFDERVVPWVDAIERVLRSEVQRCERAVLGSELRRAMVAAGHPVTSQTVCHGLAWLRKHGRSVRVEIPATDTTRRRVRYAWGVPDCNLRVEHVMATHADLLYRCVDELTARLGRPAARGEIKAWVAAGLPDASTALQANAEALNHISRRLLPALLTQHERLVAHRPSAAARGTLGPRYALHSLSAVEAAAVSVEDAIERFRFGWDLDAERQLRAMVDVRVPVIAKLLERRAIYRRAALRVAIPAGLPTRDGLNLATTAAEEIIRWLPTSTLQKRAGSTYRRARRILEDAAVVDAEAAGILEEDRRWQLAGDAALRDWGVLQQWQEELVDLAPRSRSASSIMAEARRFPVPHQQSVVETAETALDVVDALRQLLATAPLPGAKALLDGVWMLLGSVMRAPEELTPLLTPDDHVPPLLRRAALVAIAMLGGDLEINPVEYGHQQLDLDALALAAVLEPSASLESIVSALTPIADRPLATRARAELLIRRAEQGARLGLTHVW